MIKYFEEQATDVFRSFDITQHDVYDAVESLLSKIPVVGNYCWVCARGTSRKDKYQPIKCKITRTTCGKTGFKFSVEGTYPDAEKYKFGHEYNGTFGRTSISNTVFLCDTKESKICCENACKELNARLIKNGLL